VKTSTGIEIRIATMDDASEVVSVLRLAFAEYEPLYTKEAYAATTTDVPTIRARMREAPLWVAAQNKHIVGTASAVRTDVGLYIRGMAVVPNVRRLGVGRLLLQRVERFATENDCARLFLSTTPFLYGAIRLYEAFGFRSVNETPHELFGTPLFTMEKALVRDSAIPGR
jgi:GNAT superfamily N-acetyltransferase